MNDHSSKYAISDNTDDDDSYRLCCHTSFHNRNFGIVDDNPSMTVEGIAGSEIPSDTGESEKEEIFAYIFFTDDGIYAVTSHPGIEDSSEVKDDADWHAHKVQLNDENCIIDLKEKGKAVLDGNTVSVEKTKATEVTKVLTGGLATDTECNQLHYLIF